MIYFFEKKKNEKNEKMDDTGSHIIVGLPWKTAPAENSAGAVFNEVYQLRSDVHVVMVCSSNASDRRLKHFYPNVIWEISGMLAF